MFLAIAGICENLNTRNKKREKMKNWELAREYTEKLEIIMRDKYPQDYLYLAGMVGNLSALLSTTCVHLSHHHPEAFEYLKKRFETIN